MSEEPSHGEQPAPGPNKSFYGKYRGKVLDNLDPLMLGRIIAEVPAIAGSILNWALPCVPYAGFQVGFYAIPPIAANVWIEFEGGDPKYPIWTGCFWSEGEVPVDPAGGPPNPLVKIFQTEFIKLCLNDEPGIGGFTLICTPPAVATPLSMVFNSLGVQINAMPASMKLIVEDGITLSYPPSNLGMTAAMIELSFPESRITQTAAAMEILAGDVSVAATSALGLSAGADVSVSAGAAAEISAGGDVSIEAGLACEVSASLDLELTAGGLLNAKAADVAITAAAIALSGVVEVSGVPLQDEPPSL